ncbi:metallophosphoesterase [Hansschlegelia plantiphila]|uniref:Metallophosphoesterase n=1 Tax=Hansschlegelia plantiphila TaxID=374655 RepID=A0A9W6MUG9_9HYPH|nr:metallophosphoesterase [Hansschlegelia plantiphila]GLK67389.1 metallophosphoesterase [Hansschlegelia plantiphila]
MALITRRALLTSAGAGFLVSASGGAYAGLIEPSLMLATTEYRLTPPGWPADLPLTIAVISDTHVCEPYVPMARVKRIVETVNRLKPDLIVHLGDHEGSYHVASSLFDPTEWAAAYADLSAPLGLYTILGNHDWWHHARSIRSALDGAKIRVMENEAELIEHRGRRFWLAGLGDQIAHWLGRGSFRGVDDLPGTLAQLKTDDPALLLIHEPDIFDEVPARVSLTLAGHTHGGQIYIPGIRNPFIPANYSGRFRYGHVVEDDRHLIISGGIGMSSWPVRFGVPPEIVIVKLGNEPAVA